MVPASGLALGAVNRLAVSGQDPLMAAFIAVGYRALDEAHLAVASSRWVEVPYQA